MFQNSRRTLGTELHGFGGELPLVGRCVHKAGVGTMLKAKEVADLVTHFFEQILSKADAGR